MLTGSGITNLVADVLLGLDRLFRGTVLAETTATFEDLTGMKPRSVGA